MTRIGIIGHVDHNKTSLTAAITHVLASSPEVVGEPPRVGDWMQTFTGRKFYPIDPWVEEIFIEDIAHSLAMQCRYGGHCLRRYSVAEHSVHMARFVSEPNKLWALLHDAPEAYLVDVPRPIKHKLEGYSRIESRLMYQIARRFNLGTVGERDIPREVKDADNRILVDEKHQNMAPGPAWTTLEGLEPIGVTIECWSPEEAERQFLQTFAELTR